MDSGRMKEKFVDEINVFLHIVLIDRGIFPDNR